MATSFVPAGRSVAPVTARRRARVAPKGWRSTAHPTPPNSRPRGTHHAALRTRTLCFSPAAAVAAKRCPMDARPLYVGIDLGTTNSAAAVFDGETLSSVRNTEGGVLTPSVVRIDRRGNGVVGAKARRFLETDPDNTHAEFKRLMGTEQRFEFRAAGLSRSAPELSGLVLQALRNDIQAQLGVAPQRAVVSVPALFELPQTSATSEAARLAGFEQIEMIQEPVASALASGWRNDRETGAWLVYDLGGGTFDASLLESQEGLLRVVGHDGDNFLGGRDFDARIVDHLIAELARSGGHQLDRKNPAHASVLRRLRLLAEEAKIELTRSPRASMISANLELEGETFELDLELERSVLERLIEPLIGRTLRICQRLLASKGMDAGALSRIVLVGGPTAMPVVRRRIAETLGVPIAPDVDPMTVVAHGAALFAAAAHLDGRPPVAVAAVAGPRVWLQHPAMTSDLTPFVVGKLVSEAEPIEAVQLRRADGGWTSAAEPLAPDQTFTAMVSLQPRVTSTFEIVGLRAGQRVPLAPPTFSIIHGIALGEPPLSRSIGVALADNSVRTYADRGAPLPLRRSFTHRTVEAVGPALPGHALRVPIVQGEFPWAHLCRLVGVLELPSAELRGPLPADSTIEVTIELDRGGRLQARAHVAHLGQVFDRVARLVIAGSNPEELEANIEAAEGRTEELRARAFRDKDSGVLKNLSELDELLGEARDQTDAARGGDADAAQRARRLVIEAAALLDQADAVRAWPELLAEVESKRAHWLGWIALHGTAAERTSAERSGALLDRALAARNPREAERQLGNLSRLGVAAYLREPGAWHDQFLAVKGRVAETSDPARARAAVERGERALSADDQPGVQNAVRELWGLLPPDARDRELGHDSGVR